MNTFKFLNRYQNYDEMVMGIIIYYVRNNMSWRGHRDVVKEGERYNSLVISCGMKMGGRYYVEYYVVRNNEPHQYRFSAPVSEIEV